MKDIEFRLAKKSELATIAVLSRNYIERGLGWSWTPERLKKSYLSRDTNILVACTPSLMESQGKWKAENIARYEQQQNQQQKHKQRLKQTVVGFGIMHYGATEANLNLLAVVPDYRRTGIGKLMVQWLEKSALTAGIDVVYLQCRAVNVAAQQFYQKMGYRKLRNLPKYYSAQESAVLMGHDLLMPAPNLFLQKPY
ncbi:GNAT family N-acetyltransferase [Kaarinaea lacus]